MGEYVGRSAADDVLSDPHARDMGRKVSTFEKSDEPYAILFRPRIEGAPRKAAHRLPNGVSKESDIDLSQEFGAST